MSYFTSFSSFPRVVIFSFLTVLVSCSKVAPLHKTEGFAQGTSYHISWWSESDVSAEVLQPLLEEKLAAIDKELSTYREDSFISRFNRNPSLAWQEVSEDFIELLHVAHQVNVQSLGCYDPTIGPLFSLWGFDKDQFVVPSQADIEQVQAHLGLDKIEIDPTNKRIRKLDSSVALDFSSMGEGYTIGELSQIMAQRHIDNYLIEFGGDMQIKGQKPDGSHWKIAVEKPIPQQQGIEPYQLVSILSTAGVTLDTSGSYHHSFDKDGKSYSHILDARTGAPVAHHLVSSSVFGQDPVLGDAWATAMMCLGPKQGQLIAKKQGLEVFFIEQDGQVLTQHTSDALRHSPRVSLTQ
ncbi:MULTISPECIES: FAD:protein FMN transferase [unclassified Vibrio]|uniref:FAD:protein FMN transferase n=1 Tax=Vibrio sp. HB236076 TaxID=3232307 RepID=A0AB39HKK4_9VIBR|nr:FAD:protein FMN transferase [Vibrio sp. HB161653]MDP5252684.1 FAD:protein FMN transferase [Vibrio sp. HB161653]